MDFMLCLNNAPMVFYSHVMFSYGKWELFYCCCDLPSFFEPLTLHATVLSLFLLVSVHASDLLLHNSPFSLAPYLLPPTSYVVNDLI